MLFSNLHATVYPSVINAVWLTPSGSFRPIRKVNARRQVTSNGMHSCISDIWSACWTGRFYFGLLVFVVVVNEVSGSSIATNGNEETKGNIKFSLDLYKKLADVNGNLVTSPASLEIVLALTYIGAKGSTARQIASVINKTNDPKSVTSSALSLLKVLKSADNVTLESASGMFIQKHFEVKNEFKLAGESLSSVAQNTDFSQAETAASVINKWVEQATNGKIKNMVSEDSISPFTKLILINAIYFKAPWKIPFNKKQTSIEPFYTTRTQKKDVPMMYMKKRLGYSQLDEIDSDVLELQYEGRNLSMVILLPRKIDGLRVLENQLRVADIIEALRTIYPAEVEVTLPRFLLQNDINLNPTLIKLGLSDMFDRNLADFSGISDTGLFVSQVKQRTFIEVNEKGTEAAASTTATWHRIKVHSRSSHMVT
ncbi:leukocyte elastase inhibitor-like isoform X3 [Schistocerca gregaria]|uniref:leukocyte elastase inhibitor-like isoform X3 n=1 Tax=Schistocerca gregaria TaxID=7010 RepID=UPI00211DE9B8|nr:leukocyte elastase inhibitor-like isoform X3 [Schistocerca gregaria]